VYGFCGKNIRTRKAENSAVAGVRTARQNVMSFLKKESERLPPGFCPGGSFFSYIAAVLII